MTNGPNDVPMPVTPQMILANMNETNQRMQRLELIIIVMMFFFIL
jgi:hypothetical protein